MKKKHLKGWNFPQGRNSKLGVKSIEVKYIEIGTKSEYQQKREKEKGNI